MGDDKDDIERELAESDGLRPDEMEGPGESDASPVRCQFRQGERMAGPEDSSFEMMDELHESFPVEPIPVVMGEDGLPEILTPDPKDAQAVPFTYETQLCIEDDRQYVEMWGHEASFIMLAPHIRGKSATRRRFDENGLERDRDHFDPEQVIERWGRTFVEREDGLLIPVRPIRERCRFYKRQVFSNDDVPDPKDHGHQLVFRICTARRSNGGAYMSLNNEAVYACDLRNPLDHDANAVQDQKDKRKLIERPDKLQLPLFNMPGDAVAVDDEAQEASHEDNT